MHGFLNFLSRGRARAAGRPRRRCGDRRGRRSAAFAFDDDSLRGATSASNRRARAHARDAFRRLRQLQFRRAGRRSAALGVLPSRDDRAERLIAAHSTRGLPVRGRQRFSDSKPAVRRVRRRRRRTAHRRRHRRHASRSPRAAPKRDSSTACCEPELLQAPIAQSAARRGAGGVEARCACTSPFAAAARPTAIAALARDATPMRSSSSSATRDDARADGDRRLRRLLFVARTRDEFGQAVSPERRAAAAELAVDSDRLSRPLEDDRRSTGRRCARPNGQRKPPARAGPVFGPTHQLDIELEVGFITGPGNRLGEPIRAGEAREHIFGLVLVNDWSARDIQAWEYQPLGPFLGKSFATTISPWVVTLDALEPFRVAGPRRIRSRSHYLRADEPCGVRHQARGRACRRSAMRERGIAPVTISRTNFQRHVLERGATARARDGQRRARRPGDLFASGTICGTRRRTRYGSLIELTWNGERPMHYPAARCAASCKTATK